MYIYFFVKVFQFFFLFILEKFIKMLSCIGISRDSLVNEKFYCCDICIDDFNIWFDFGDM